MIRYKVEMDYVGTDFSGWQSQPLKRTVQGELTLALKKLTGETAVFTGSGRTDAGVHALKQTAHFDLNESFRTAKLCSGLNHFLPQDIRIHFVEEADESFHARFSAKKKTYCYKMYAFGFESALLKDRALKAPIGLDIEAMNAAAKTFIGEKDFASFCTAGSDNKTTIREVYSSKVQEKDGIIEFTVSANGFLYNMVRIMTKVLLDVGGKKIGLGEVESIFAAKNRDAVKGLAPPCGLYLVEAQY